MKAVIYARFSSDNQREESIEGQLRECKEYAERNGITVLNSYIDRALSAKTDNRPEFQKMIKDSSKGLFNIVLVWKLDRFSRNRYDSAHYKHTLKKNGVKVISATERITDTPEGILLESMLEGYAEFYSAELSEKVKRGLKENALKCKYNGSNVPIGYMIDEERHYQINPLTAPIVREIFEKYAAGAKTSDIVADFKARGIKSATGKDFQVSSIAFILKNRRYLGEYSSSGIITPNAFEPIVSEEIFEKVQERLNKNKHSPAHFKADERYILSGKLFCGDCGMQMVADCGKSCTGKKHRYYKCYSNKQKRTCDMKAVKKEWLEDLVFKATMELLNNKPLIEQIADTIFNLQDKEPSELPLLQKQLAGTKKAISNMLNAIQQGVLTNSTKTRLEELEVQQQQLELSTAQQSLQKPRFSKEQIMLWLKQFRKSDIEDLASREKIIDIFVNSIHNYEDKVIIIFNHKDGEKIIKLSELNDKIVSSNLSTTAQPSQHKKTRLLSRVFLLTIILFHRFQKQSQVCIILFFCNSPYLS